MGSAEGAFNLFSPMKPLHGKLLTPEIMDSTDYIQRSPLRVANFGPVFLFGMAKVDPLSNNHESGR